MYNNLFEIGHFPDIFKISNLTALYKKSNSISCKSNYRPIALLPTLSKISESIIHQRLLGHFIENNIITERQAAYLKGDSTTQQLLYIIHKIKSSWTQGNITQGVFLDVSAAFDKCWHLGLLAKLKQISVEDQFYDILTSYLTNRKQCVVVDGCKSDMKDIEAGVPQGSRLGPLLWILYAQDIIENLESEVLLFADDTCLFVSAKDPAETSAILNRDLSRISDWASTWKVTFNPGKSKDMIFSNKYLLNSPPLIFNGTFVERVQDHKHLGVYLSSSLDWG
jgi:ribonuclease P/MRP protein subunit RPP40